MALWWSNTHLNRMLQGSNPIQTWFSFSFLLPIFFNWERSMSGYHPRKSTSLRNHITVTFQTQILTPLRRCCWLEKRKNHLTRFIAIRNRSKRLHSLQKQLQPSNRKYILLNVLMSAFANFRCCCFLVYVLVMIGNFTFSQAQNCCMLNEYHGGFLADSETITLWVTIRFLSLD